MVILTITSTEIAQRTEDRHSAGKPVGAYQASERWEQRLKPLVISEACD